METKVVVTGAEASFKCSFCHVPVTARIFPRLTIEPPADPLTSAAGGGEATCQFYPGLKAEVICDECGCFMSQKASITWGEKILCMPCLHTLRETKADTNYRASLKIWDNRALALLAFLPFTLFTAPIALFVLFRYRNEPRGWIPRSSFRWWLALFLTGVILLGWITLIAIWITLMAREATD